MTLVDSSFSFHSASSEHSGILIHQLMNLYY